MDQIKAGWAQAEQRLQPPRVDVKGIYLKDDWGNITFDADIPRAREAGAVNPDFADLQAWTVLLRSKRVYSIARIVTFKDAYMPKHRPDLAVHSTAGPNSR